MLWLEFKLTEGLYPIIDKRTMMTHCFLYVRGIRLVTVEIFHTSVSSARTLPNTGVVDSEIASLRLHFEKRLRHKPWLYCIFCDTLNFAQKHTFHTAFSAMKDYEKHSQLLLKLLSKKHPHAVVKVLRLDCVGLANGKQASRNLHFPYTLSELACRTGAVYFGKQIHSSNLSAVTSSLSP